MTAQVFHRLARILASMAVVALFTIASAQGQTPRYKVTNLGPLFSSSDSVSVTALSEDGTKVVGQAYVNGTSHSFYWDGAMHDIGITGNSHPIAVSSNGVVVIGYSLAYPTSVWTLAVGAVALTGPNSPPLPLNVLGMNDSGEVAGIGPTTTILGYFQDGSPNYARVGLRWIRNPATGKWDYTILRPLAGHDSSYTAQIDKYGNIIGRSLITNPNTGQIVVEVAVRWSPGDGYVPHEIGPLNLQGFINGFAVDPLTLDTRYVWHDQSNGTAFYTDSTGTVEIPQPSSPDPQNITCGMNTVGVVAGFATYGSDRHAYAWASGILTDLGVLPGKTTSGMSQDFFARPINDKGFIVGYSAGSGGARAFVSTPANRSTSSKMLDLNQLLANTLSSVGLTSLTQAISINDAGFIICYGDSATGGQRAVLLTNVTGAAPNLLKNPEFEEGAGKGWLTTPYVITSDTYEPSLSGDWKAWLCGYGRTHTDTLAQAVTIPAKATSATLAFWLHVDTQERSATAHDKLNVQIKKASGAILTLATYSNANAADGFFQKQFDLSAYRGQTIQILLTGTEDRVYATNFIVDDFTLFAPTTGP